MRVVMCGSREYDDGAMVRQAFNELSFLVDWRDLIIVHGAARGADALADRFAKDHGIAVEPHPAQWELLGRAAGPIRNIEMLDSGVDLLIAFGTGKGTEHIVGHARACGIQVERYP